MGSKQFWEHEPSGLEDELDRMETRMLSARRKSKNLERENTDLRAQLAEKDKVIEGLREAIAVFEFNTEHDPIYNLEGAISDLEGRIKDEVILQTLYRVQEQLGRCYHAALNAAPNTDGAQ